MSAPTSSRPDPPERLEERLAALATPALREALLFARAATQPFTVDDAAAGLACHRTVARQRLDRLEAAGLVSAEFRRAPGRGGPGAGRPPKVYRVVPEQAVTDFPPHRYAELVGLLAETLGDGGDEQLRATGRRFAGILLAGMESDAPSATLEDAVRVLCRRLGEMGFQARAERVEPGAVSLRVPTCPLRPVVGGSPAAVGLDRGMWEGLVGHMLGVPVRVTCLTEGCDVPGGDCTVVLTADRPAEAGP